MSHIEEIISQGESLSVEFKSDRGPLSDKELVAAIVSLANTDGGYLLLGVEDDGAVTGVHQNHKDITGMSALIANKTIPSMSVKISEEIIEGKQIFLVKVSKSRQLVSTSDGLLQRRCLMTNGKPQAVPFFPHEFVQRQSYFGLVDPSNTPMKDCSLTDFDPIQRLRIREAIRKYGGDQSLLPLADDELDGALGFTCLYDGERYPTLAGILFLGTESLIRRTLPAHEVAFQVLSGTDVKVNEFFKKPLLQTFEEIDLLFNARITEDEIEVGLFRVPVPNFSHKMFREALVNALVHRDYSKLGAVHIKIEDDYLTISSPGSFVEGVTLNNLIVTEPRPRNPVIADIVKRIGLAERTGRGIDRIYEGVLRYGRPSPDFSRSDNSSVVLRVTSSETDLQFLKMIIQYENLTNKTMPIDSLIVLSRLREERRLTTTDLMLSTQKSESETRNVLEKLHESGFIETHGTGRGRTYTLSAKVYNASGQQIAYIHQAGFDEIQQEQMILKYIDTNGKITRENVMDLCHLSKDQAYKMLKKMRDSGVIDKIGDRKSSFYERI